MRTAQSFWRVLALVLLVGALWWLDLAQLPGLNPLRDGRDALRALVQEQPLASAALYFGIYLAVAALSIPGAAMLTLAGGALFGFGAGLLLVSFASSIGATLAFLASRHLLREGDALVLGMGPWYTPADKDLDELRRFMHAVKQLVGASGHAIFKSCPRGAVSAC